VKDDRWHWHWNWSGNTCVKTSKPYAIMYYLSIVNNNRLLWECYSGLRSMLFWHNFFVALMSRLPSKLNVISDLERSLSACMELRLTPQSTADAFCRIGKTRNTWNYKALATTITFVAVAVETKVRLKLKALGLVAD